jgi:hypothetical protein
MPLYPSNTLWPANTLWPSASVGGATVTPAVIALTVTAPQVQVGVGVAPVTFSLPQLFFAPLLVDAGANPAGITVVVSFPQVTVDPGISGGLLYFTPPHRGKFVAYFDIEIEASLTQPYLSMTPHNPQPPNLWIDPDTGLLTEKQPATMNPDTKMFAGGHIYGPLSAEDVQLLVNSGYGAYLSTDPNPTPQP